MGRSSPEDGGVRGGVGVKRQVVSVGRGPGVEVVSEEKFARRLQGMSGSGGCVDCHRERSGQPTSAKGQGRSKAARASHRSNNNNKSGSSSPSKKSGKPGRGGKQGGKRIAGKPIVVHIKDTLRSALQHRGSVGDTDSDTVSVRSIDEDLFGDVSSIPEFKPQRYIQYPASDSPPPPPLPPLTQPSAVSRMVRGEKSKKNLTALISVMEKAHHKERCHVESNLAGPSYADSKLCRLLNNQLCGRGNAFSQQRSIADCENVEVICNDLYKHGKGGGGEDADSVCDDNSSVSSSSEAASDPECILVEESSGFEFSSEELQRLAQYTTGYPIYRYDCSPDECPQCMSMWYYHKACLYDGCYTDAASSAHSAWTRSGCRDGDHDTTLEASEEEEEAEETESEDPADCTVRAIPGKRSRTSGSTPSAQEPASDLISWGRDRSQSPSSVPGVDCVELGPPSTRTPHHSRPSLWSGGPRQLWDIDISPGGRVWGGVQQQHPSNPYPNSVYLELTGTDVSISVFYHHSLLQDPGARAALQTYRTEADPCCAGAAKAPLFSLCYQGSPLCGLNLPVAFFTDHPRLPHIAMVPPHELSTYVSTPPVRQLVENEEKVIFQCPTAEFSVQCYNVLCDRYCTQQQYSYCPTWARNWTYRRTLLMKQFCSGADILCLQEMEAEQLENFFMPELRTKGYSSVFVPKTRARTMANPEDRAKVDGCAILFNRQKFSLVESRIVEFNQTAAAHGKGNRDMLNRVMTKDNVGLIVLLETRPAIFGDSEEQRHLADEVRPNLLVVATAHMHWDPEDCDVKMVQTMMMMSELQTFMTHVVSAHPLAAQSADAVPLLFCADLNSLPDSGVVEYLRKICNVAGVVVEYLRKICNVAGVVEYLRKICNVAGVVEYLRKICNVAGVVEYLTQGKVSWKHPEFKENEYEDVLPKFCEVDDEYIYHDFDFRQTCTLMPFTNYTYNFKGIIDYMLYTADGLDVMRQMGPDDESWFHHQKVMGCPNEHYPSDHVPLFVTFQMPFSMHQDPQKLANNPKIQEPCLVDEGTGDKLKDLRRPKNHTMRPQQSYLLVAQAGLPARRTDANAQLVSNPAAATL
ncbi:hypothetical protein ACOMHN_043598 [Nucella lapillus]